MWFCVCGVLCRVPSTPDPSGLSAIMTKVDFDQIRVREMWLMHGYSEHEENILANK